MKINQLLNQSGFFVKQCLHTGISLAKVIVRLHRKTALPGAKEDSCILLGNGPSLKTSLDQNPDFFRKHPLICVNSFSLTNEYTELKPSYCVILDPGFWMSSESVVINTVQSLIEKTSWPLIIMIPREARRSALFSGLEKQNNNIKVIYFNYTVFKGFTKISHFFYKRNIAMPQSQNVLVAALFLGINIGYKNIYLFGADHTWHENLHIDENNVLCVKHIHFYEKEEKVSYVPFYKSLHSKAVFRMDEIFLLFTKTFHGYVALDKYAKSRGCIIYNASKISFIDAFKRIKL